MFLQQLRIQRSLFYLPLYWFAVTQLVNVNWSRSVLSLIILFFLLLPAANGFTFLAKSPGPHLKLKIICSSLSVIAILATAFISIPFTIGVVTMIVLSRLLDQFRLESGHFIYSFFHFITGALLFSLSFHGSSLVLKMNPPVSGMLASGLLVTGFQLFLDNPRQSKKRIRLSGIFISLALLFTGYSYLSSLLFREFGVLLICFLPVLFFYVIWLRKQDVSEYDNNRMKLVVLFCTNAGFFLPFLMTRFL